MHLFLIFVSLLDKLWGIANAAELLYVKPDQVLLHQGDRGDW